MGEGYSPLNAVFRDIERERSLGIVTRQRRSALDFGARTPPMARNGLEHILDVATRDWCADWRGNFGGEDAADRRGTDFVTIYLYVHRVRDCDPGVYRWDCSTRTLEQLHRGNAERVAAYLSLEQALAGNACFAISMVADLAAAARNFGNRGYRYVHFEPGAIRQTLYLRPESLPLTPPRTHPFYHNHLPPHPALPQ